jgi:two-component sensor histidine kinase
MARHFVANRVQDPEVAQLAALLVSELATNAVVHARTPFEVRVKIGRCLRVEVDDEIGGRPRLKTHHPSGGHGRGLHVVDAMASSWGVQEVAAGKRVWFELELPCR